MRPPLIKPSQRYQLRQPTKSEPKPLGDRASDALKLAFGIVSLVGLGLACSGFGVALALTTIFDLHLSEVLHGPLDYVAVSAYVVLQLFTMTKSLTENEMFLGALWSIVGPAVAVGIALLWTTVSILTDERLTQSKPVEIARASAIGIWQWAVSLSMFRAACPYLAFALGVVAAAIWANVGTGNHTVIALLSLAVVLFAIADWRSFRVGGLSFGVGAGTAAFVHLLPHLILSLVSVSLIPFVIAFDVAERYFYESVIEPVSCSPLRNAKVRRERWIQSQMKNPSRSPVVSINTAKCVQVERKDAPVKKGREVISTTDLVVLFDPVSGAVQTVPHKDSVVTTIERLDGPPAAVPSLPSAPHP